MNSPSNIEYYEQYLNEKSFLTTRGVLYHTECEDGVL